MQLPSLGSILLLLSLLRLIPIQWRVLLRLVGPQYPESTVLLINHSTYQTQTGRLPAATGSAGASSGVLFPITGESAAGTGTRSKGTSTNTKSGVVIGTTTAAGPLATSTGKAGNTTYALVVNPQAGIQKFIPFMIEAEVGSTVDIQVYGNGAGLKIVETVS